MRIIDRRDFVKTLGVVGLKAIPLQQARAQEQEPEKEFFGVLIDPTCCVGCQTSSLVCTEAHKLPELDLYAMFQRVRNTQVFSHLDGRDQW
jgi:Fe-S-cluster-containing dehydrogenase component